MTITLATTLLDEARRAIEAARIHIETAGAPTSDLEASNLAAAYYESNRVSQAHARVRALYDLLLPDGVWEFPGGRVQRLPGGNPVWTSGVVQHVYPFERFGGLRPWRWELMEDWD